MEVSNAMKKENILVQSAFKSSAKQSYRTICEIREERKTPRNCDVHHINGNHFDNRPENLIIIPRDMHCWLHNGSSRVNPWMKQINWFDFKKELIK